MGMKRQAKGKANEYSRSQSFLFLFVSKVWHQELVLRPRRLRGTGGSGGENSERAVPDRLKALNMLRNYRYKKETASA